MHSQSCRHVEGIEHQLEVLEVFHAHGDRSPVQGHPDHAHGGSLEEIFIYSHLVLEQLGKDVVCVQKTILLTRCVLRKLRRDFGALERQKTLIKRVIVIR